MRIGVCDDEANCREVTIQYIKEYNNDFEITEYENGSALLQEKERLDLIFLDIEMPGMNGMETAKELRRQKADSELVFLTTHNECVYDAFEVRAFRFLKKPLVKEVLFHTLERAEDELAAIERVDISLKDGMCSLKVKDIVYIEAYGDGVFVYDKDGNVYEERRGTLKEWTERLKGKGFARIHRGYLISMFYIERYGSTEVKLRGVETALEVSRKQASVFKKEFREFVEKNARVL